MTDSIRKFGKYFLLDMIALGGMAEIYRARMATPDGGGRLLAIKRVIASYSQNPEFVAMFKGEIKTTSGFTHPNIVQLYDYGEEEGLLYIAMELVDGKNLRQFMSRFAEIKALFPLEVSAYIIEQAAHGMAYAHAFKDKITGKPLNIVHRDISPQNILISYDGAVKVIDFGIAKAVTNVESTRAGVIKGKPNYMSPEQVIGDVLDGRSDIFALGIVFWELLTGKKLFSSDNDYAVLKLIENCHTVVKPPSLINAKVPKELDAIVLKCLQRKREDRYQTAEELQRALHKFLYQFAQEFNPADLSYYARDLFKDEIVEDRKRLMHLNDKVEMLLSGPTITKQASGVRTKAYIEEEITAQIKRALPQTNDTASLSDVDDIIDKSDTELEKNRRTVPAKQQPVRVDLDLGPTAPTHSTAYSKNQMGYRQKPEVATRTQPMRPWTGKMFGAVASLVIVIAAGVYHYKRVQQEDLATELAAQKSATIDVVSNLRAVELRVDGVTVSDQLPFTIKDLPPGKMVRVVAMANGFEPSVNEIALKPGERFIWNAQLKPINIVETLNRTTAAQDGSSSAVGRRLVNVIVQVHPVSFMNQITVNGQVATAGVASAAVGEDVSVVVERDGYATYRKTHKLLAADVNENNEIILNVQLGEAKFGYLSLKSSPSADAYITLNGVEEHYVLPMSRKRIPIGRHRVRLVNAALGVEKVIDIEVKEDRFESVEVKLSGNSED